MQRWQGSPGCTTGTAYTPGIPTHLMAHLWHLLQWPSTGVGLHSEIETPCVMAQKIKVVGRNSQCWFYDVQHLKAQLGVSKVETPNVP